MFGRQKIAMIVAEFLGTGFLTLTVLSVSRSQIGFTFFIGLAAGLAMLLGSLTLGRVSGGHFNPAITIGMWSANQIKTAKAIIYIAAQIVGAYVAYMLFTYFVKQTFPNTKGHYDAHVLVAEITGAFVFSLGFAAALYQKLEPAQKSSLIGGSLALGIIVASSASAATINPAVALGTRTWVWGTYVAGPVIGAVLGFAVYRLLFAPAFGAAVRSKAESAKASVAASSAGAEKETKKTSAKKPAGKK